MSHHQATNPQPPPLLHYNTGPGILVRHYGSHECCMAILAVFTLTWFLCLCRRRWQRRGAYTFPRQFTSIGLLYLLLTEQHFGCCQATVKASGLISDTVTITSLPGNTWWKLQPSKNMKRKRNLCKGYLICNDKLRCLCSRQTGDLRRRTHHHHHPKYLRELSGLHTVLWNFHHLWRVGERFASQFFIVPLITDCTRVTTERKLSRNAYWYRNKLLKVSNVFSAGRWTSTSVSRLSQCLTCLLAFLY